MKLSLVDMHCDTLYEMYKNGVNFSENNLACSLKNASNYDFYTQVMAIWSDKNKSDDFCYLSFYDVYDYALNNLPENISFDYKNKENKVKLILSVEDARILGNDIARLFKLYDIGLRIITPVWSGVNCLGGAYDTNEGLSDFGKEVIKICFRLGIIVDISHCSLKTIEDIFILNSLSNPIIASHSNSFSVFPHKRNLNDKNFNMIKESGGLVGINLCSAHLGLIDSNNSLSQILKHIDYYLSLGGEDNICFGCDFDGATTPSDFKNPNDLVKIAEYMLKNSYSENIVKKLFWENATKFVDKYIK